MGGVPTSDAFALPGDKEINTPACSDLTDALHLFTLPWKANLGTDIAVRFSDVAVRFALRIANPA